jgi:hypothetical protein
VRRFLQVFVQPLQLRRAGTVQGFDMSAANQWHWRPDYEVVELAQCRCVTLRVPLCCEPDSAALGVCIGFQANPAFPAFDPSYQTSCNTACLQG